MLDPCLQRPPRRLGSVIQLIPYRLRVVAVGILCVGRTAKAIQARQENTHDQRRSFVAFASS